MSLNSPFFRSSTFPGTDDDDPVPHVTKKVRKMVPDVDPEWRDRSLKLGLRSRVGIYRKFRIILVGVCKLVERSRVRLRGRLAEVCFLGSDKCR